MNRDVPCAAAGEELEAESALSGARLGRDADHLAFALRGALQAGLETGHLRVAAHEARESSRARKIQTGPQRSEPPQFVHRYWIAHVLHLVGAEVFQLEETAHQVGRVGGEINGVGRGQLLDVRSQIDGVALRGVVHPQVIADPADHDVAGVEPHAHREGDAALALQLLGVAVQSALEQQRGVAGALSVVFVRDGGAEECHDTVAGELVDRAFEAMDALRQDLEEAVEDCVPLFGVEHLGQRGGALDVSEEDGYLLAFTLHRALGGEDLAGQVTRCVLQGIAFE